MPAPSPGKGPTMELRYKMLDILPLLSVPQPPIGRSSYNIPCPLCDHPNTRDGHLNINLKKNVFRCSKCGEFYGGVFDLYAYFKNISRDDVQSALQGRLVGSNSYKKRTDKATKRPAPVRTPQAPLADIDIRNHTYQALLDQLSLDSDHKENLLHRGLSEDEIVRLQYRTTPQDGFQTIAKNLVAENCQLLGVPGFYVDKSEHWTMSAVRKGIIIPCRDRLGRIQRLHIRTDTERRGKFRPLSSVDKPNGCATENWCHLAGPVQENILLIEGYMKADIVHYLTGQTVLAVPGVTGLQHLADTLSELIPLGVGHIMTCFDMDYLKNWHVESAYSKLLELLSSLSITFGTYLWSPEFNGLDDFIWEFCLQRGKVSG